MTMVSRNGWGCIRRKAGGETDIMSTSITVGNVEILAFVDIGPAPREPAMVFPDVPADAWGPYKDTMTPDGLLPFQMGFFAVRSGGQTMLVDTGLGRGPHEMMGGIGGKLMDQLNGAGISVGDVSRVLITHLHGDHVGWNITWDGDAPRATFPNATYFVPQGDWEHFMSAEVIVNSPHMEQNVIPLQTLSAMQLVGDGEEITTEITTLVTPGHTPGHQCFLISSAGERAIIIGDALHTAAQLTETSWNVGFDVDKPLAAQTRASLVQRLEDEGLAVASGHMPVGSNIGRVIRLDGKRTWQVL